MSEAEPKFKAGDRIVVVENPHEGYDAWLAGKTGAVVRHTATNLIDQVFSVKLKDIEEEVLLYAKDLKPVELTLEEKKAKLEAELAEVEKAIKEQKQKEDRDVSLWPVGSSIRISDTVLIKVKENKWHWIAVQGSNYQFHSTSGDRVVKLELDSAKHNGVKWAVDRVDKD